MDEAQVIREEELASELELRDVVFMLRRRWLLILATWAAVMLVTAFFVFSTTPQYKAVCKLLVEAGSSSARSNLSNIPGAELMAQARVRTVETQLEVLQSGRILTEALKQLSLPLDPKPISAFRAQAIKNTDVIYLQVESPNPEIAAKVANKMGEVYIEQTKEQSRQAASQAKDFIQQQLQLVRQDLSRAEQELVAFQKREHLYVIGTEAQAISNRLLTYEQEQADVELSAKAALARRKADEAQLAKQPQFEQYSKTTQLNPHLESLKKELIDLETQKAQLLAELTENDPRVKAIEAQIDGVRDQMRMLAERVENSITLQQNPIAAHLASDAVQQQVALAEYEARRAGLQRLRQLTEQKLKALPEREVELARLQRNLSVAENTYTSLLQQLQNYKLSEAMAVPKATIIDPASVPSLPFKPKTVLSFAIAFALGLIFGLALAIAVERMDDTIRDPKDIEQKLGLSILGVIPLAERDEPTLVTEASPRSGLVEAYRTLRSNVRFTASAGHGVDDGATVLLVTSSAASEGKSSVAYNLAVVTAQLGQRVILVDSDLRRPKLHRILQVESSTGLTNVLVGDVQVEDVLKPTQVEGLAFLPTGPLPPNPAELLDSPAMTEVIQQLRGMAEVVILDSPPVAVVTDSQLLAARADGVLLVLSSGETRLGLATRAKELLERAGAHFYGAVANKVDTRREGYYYYYYYYYYGYYGEEK